MKAIIVVLLVYMNKKKQQEHSSVPQTFQVNPAFGIKDEDLGLEIISFDDPVNTIPSANLVKGDFVSSSENSIFPLVNK